MDRYDGEPVGAEGPDVSWADLARTSLSWLFSTDDAALARCVRDVLADLDHPTQVLAAFGNAPLPR